MIDYVKSGLFNTFFYELKQETMKWSWRWPYDVI